MEMLIDEIPSEGLSITASEKDEWLREIIEECLAIKLTPDDHVNIELYISRAKRSVSVRGNIGYTYHPECDLCLKKFACHDEVPFFMLMEPSNNKPLDDEEEGLSCDIDQEDDLEYGHYLGDRLDIGEMIREQIILALPMRRICQTACKGLCQRCGKDLNDGPCDCTEDHTDPRWAKLATFKRRLEDEGDL